MVLLQYLYLVPIGRVLRVLYPYVPQMVGIAEHVLECIAGTAAKPRGYCLGVPLGVREEVKLAVRVLKTVHILRTGNSSAVRHLLF